MRFLQMKLTAAIATALLGLHWSTAEAQAAAVSRFVTLGTNAGPDIGSRRAQPANYLQYGDMILLVDAGDGAAEQLGKAGVRFGDVDAVLISHLHFDHIGGLFGFLGRRYQTRAEGSWQFMVRRERNAWWGEARRTATRESGHEHPSRGARARVRA